MKSISKALLTLFSGVVLYSTQRISAGVEHLNMRVTPAAQTVGEILVEITKLQDSVNGAIRSQDRSAANDLAAGLCPNSVHRILEVS